MTIYRGRINTEVYLASLLYDAIEDSDLNSVKTLLSTKKADPNLVLPKRRISPFHLIIGNDSEKFTLEVTALILQHGGNPNVKCDDGLTPVHIAAAWGRLEVLRLLLYCGGDPEPRDNNQKTPSYYAEEGNFQDCLGLLKFFASDPSVLGNGKKDNCYELVLDKVLVNNGVDVGEYDVVEQFRNRDDYRCQLRLLQEKSQENSREYVMNWFNTQPRVVSYMAKDSGEQSGDSSCYESDQQPSMCAVKGEVVFRKFYRKRVKKRGSPSKSVGITEITDSDNCREFSRESGLVTLPNSGLNDGKLLDFDKSELDTSSDYMTCSTGSCPILERNVFETKENSLITNDETASKSEGIGSYSSSFCVSEVYRYIDQDENVVLNEKRFLKTPKRDCNSSTKSCSTTYSRSSLPEVIDYDDYDTDTIRKELTRYGYDYGPITVTTKRVYLKKLRQLSLQPINDTKVNRRVYSAELEKTVKNPDWTKNVDEYKILDDALFKQFNTPDPARKWREGVNKSSFTYLLLDSRITNNLPHRSESLPLKDVWECFLSAVFYVGKGKRSRPYSHLYEALSLWNQGQRSSNVDKLCRILNVWSDNCGVVCLHVFQNTIPVEAFTREAAIIAALGIDNLCNVKAGDFYGTSAMWSRKKKTMLGVFLLYKAMMIFLNEGERQLFPSDIN